MFGSSPNPIPENTTAKNDTQNGKGAAEPLTTATTERARGRNGSPVSPKKGTDDAGASGERKRRSSGVSKAKDMFSNAKQSLHLHGSEKGPQSTMQKMTKADPALTVPQGSHNNSAGESVPGPKSTFRVGVTEDKNKKCRRTMEDTHAYLYNFLSTPAALTAKSDAAEPALDVNPEEVVETDNGYFAIFDGHAGTFAADWCGKKLHHILEETIRKNPNTPIPELLDQTFTVVDQQLEKLPLKNSGCTAVIAVLRWEDRVPNPASATGSTYLNQAAAKVTSDPSSTASADVAQNNSSAVPESAPDGSSAAPEVKLKESATRQRVLYTANVGDARIVLCRSGRALRLSYDHKGSDENEGRRVANAGGLILNNRVNGVLAVTRALGDAYMKDLVTGHPYTTETVIQPDQDEFIILACDGVSLSRPSLVLTHVLT